MESGTYDVICQFCTVKGMVVESEVLKAQNCALSKIGLPMHFYVGTLLSRAQTSFFAFGTQSSISGKKITKKPNMAKNLNEKPNIARILYYEMFDIEKKQNQKNIKSKGMQNVKVCHPPRKAGTIK